MKAPIRFLTTLAQAFSAMNLYKEGHPARERAVEAVHTRLQELQGEEAELEFLFLGSEVVFERHPIRELKGWDWAERFAAVGVQKLQFTGPVTRDDLDGFLAEVMALLLGRPIPTAEVRQTRRTNIRWGLVQVKGQEGGEEEEEGIATATLDFSLREEADTVRWLHEEMKDRDQLHMVEAEALVRSLSVAMHSDQQFLIPLLRLKEFDQYTTTHALNVSVLAMALAEFIGCGEHDVRAFGISGLLHDLGKTRIPEEILNKPGKLTDEERRIMNRHTVEGARIILETDRQLDLAAVVAYEHHIRIDGGGYPTLRYHRKCHQCSNLVHVCDVYDALRTHRPYREAWEHKRAIGLIEEGAGTEFDGEIARAFVQMMDRWEARIATVYGEDEVVRSAGTSEDGSPDPSPPGAGEAKEAG